MRRSVPQEPESDFSCDAFRQQYKTIASFNDYKNEYLNTNDIGNYISTSLSTDIAKKTPDSTEAEMDERLQTNLSGLQDIEIRVNTMTRCITDEILRRTEKAGDIYRIQDKLTKEEKEANAMVETAKEAKERAALLNEPYSKTNRHELWFPLGRPLQAESVPVLLSFAIVFLILSLGMFLRLVNIEFKITLPSFSSVSTGNSPSIPGLPIKNLMIVGFIAAIIGLALKVSGKI